jgi:hypothetical protein
VTDKVIPFRAVPAPDDFALFACREALLAILTDARDLENARQIAGEALVAASEEDVSR